MTDQPFSGRRLQVSVAARFSVAAILSLVLAVLAGALPAAARVHKPPTFSGAAPGSVTCTVSAKVSFSPPLTHTGGGSRPSAVSAKLSGCHPSNSAVTIKSAKATGSFSKSPLSCVTLSSTGASAKLAVVWKGSLTGTVAGKTYAGKASYSPTMVSGSTATGSFAGATKLTLPFPGSAVSGCTSRRGIKKLTLTGTITLGTIATPPGPPAASLISDLKGYCALLTSGSVDCWGDNTVGQLGNGTIGSPNPTPGAVTGITTATSLASDGGGYCAVLTSGSVDCWGYNGTGDLGNGTAGSPNTTPGAVTGITTATSLASDARGDGYCAVLTSGSVDCWGDNTSGDLGNGTTTGPDCSGTCNPTPGAVTGITTATSLASDYLTGYCAVLASGSVDCWGDNTYGELGNGTTGSPNPTPGAVSGVTTATSGTSDFTGYCVVLTSGSVDCWGDNTYGELGNGTTGSPNPTPGAVSGIGP